MKRRKRNVRGERKIEKCKKRRKRNAREESKRQWMMKHDRREKVQVAESSIRVRTS